MRFNTFDQVVSWYDRTKPLVSKNHTLSDDVRPIGDRNRKWERIKKIDANTYALLDGNCGNCMWGNSDPVMHELENTMAPIVWMRREDGDFIRIRNHTNSGQSVTRYNFLTYNLPDMMRFHYTQQGKHYVRAREPGKAVAEDFILPKSKTRIEPVAGTKVLRADDIYLMFRVNGDGTFTRVGDKLKVEVNVVDKELKKQWRDKLDAFYNYCAAVAPMLDVSWSGKSEYRNLIVDWGKEQGRGMPGWIRNTSSFPTDFMREVVTQEDHPMRVAVAAYVISDIGGQRAIESQDDVRQIKATYNRVMNKALGFYKIEEK